MKKKLHKRVGLVWNLLFFLILSLLFLHVEKSLLENTSAFELPLLLKNIVNEKLVLTLFILSALSLYKFSKISKVWILLYFLLIIGRSIHILALDFNKLILFMIFSYSILCYYFYVFWAQDLDEAYYNPLFSDSDLELMPKYRIPVHIYPSLENKTPLATGHLTNWNESGCYIMLDNPTPLNGDVVLGFNFSNQYFVQEGEVVSSYNNFLGVGIRFDLAKPETPGYFKWQELYTILYDLGYIPRYFSQ